MAIRGYKALVKAQSSAIAMTAEATTMSGTNTIYTITNAAKRTLDPTTTTIVNVGGSPVTQGFYIDWLSGAVIFATAAVRTVTVTGAYVVLTTVVEAKGFSVTLERAALDATRFQQTFREFEAGLLTGKADLTLNYLTDSIFFPLLINGDKKVIEYYPNDDLLPIRFYGILTADEMVAPVEGLIEEKITFQVSTQIKQ
jgi:hypothetical protein